MRSFFQYDSGGVGGVTTSFRAGPFLAGDWVEGLVISPSVGDNPTFEIGWSRLPGNGAYAPDTECTPVGGIVWVFPQRIFEIPLSYSGPGWLHFRIFTSTALVLLRVGLVGRFG